MAAQIIDCRRCALFFALITAAMACGAPIEEDPSGDDPGEEISIRFEARVGDHLFACGEDYEGIGLGRATMTPGDLRFYVHAVHLIDETGLAVPVVLDQDGQWQFEDLAMLDFEDRTGRCDNGTSATNETIRGRAPAGSYRGLSFTLGVPLALNHIDASTAPAPLHLTAMFWSWNGGYKFLRFDAATDDTPGFRVHLGSTGCAPGPPGSVDGCLRPNRVEVVFDDFDLATDVIVADLAILLEGLDLDDAPEDSSPGCMSEPDDPACQPVFDVLGLDGGVSRPKLQRFFRLR